MKFLLGLTGSIGMGKSTTANMFRDEGVPVWDADFVVHVSYEKGGAAVDQIAKEFPTAIIDGAISRPNLRDIIKRDSNAVSQIEAIVHPIVGEDRDRFIASHDGLLLFDIPLLFETGAEEWLDAVVVVSTSPEIQAQRVLARPNMDPAQFEAIMARQMPDSEKRRRADFLIKTNTLEQTRQSVRELITTIRERMANA